MSALKRESRHFPSLVFHLRMIQSQLYKNRLRFSLEKEDEEKMERKVWYEFMEKLNGKGEFVWSPLEVNGVVIGVRKIR